MNYEQFKNELLLSMQKQARKEVYVEFRSIPKNNGIICDGLMVRYQGNPISPAICLGPVYEKWSGSGLEIDDLAVQLLESCVEEADAVSGDISFFKDFEQVREHIYMRLIHHDKNREALLHMPHRHLFDLAMVCYYRMEEGRLNGATIPITDNQLKMWEITEDQLFSIAGVNSWKKLPVCFMDMDQVIKSFCEEEQIEMPREILQQNSPVPIYILTNAERLYGACCLFYPNVQKHISEYLDCSYFILPGSIHELILVPDRGCLTGTELQEMVVEINATQVDPAEILSDTVYYYDAGENKLKIWSQEA